MIKSKFTFNIFLIPILLVLFSSVIVILSPILSGNRECDLNNMIGIFCLLFMSVWLFFVELRKRACIVTINSESIICRRYFGLGKKRSYLFNEFDQYAIQSSRTRYNEYEVFILISKQQSKIIICQEYHDNYEEMKRRLISKTKAYKISKVRYSLFDFLKNIYQ